MIGERLPTVPPSYDPVTRPGRTRHRGAWTDEHTYQARVEVEFERVEDGERVPITGEDLEVQRGQFVNFIVQETAEEMDDLREWAEEESDELAFDEAASTYDKDTRTWTVVMVQE